MRHFRDIRTRRGWIAVAAAVLALASLAGAATVGRAATNSTVDAHFVSVLNDDTANLVLGTPTPGKNIGYTYFFQNTGTNAINHIVINAYISGSSTGTPKVGAVKYFTVSDPTVSCSGNQTLTCTDSQLAAGASFTLTVIFSTNSSPAVGERIYPFFTGTYSPQSLNDTNNRKPDTKAFAADNTTFVRDYTSGLSGTKSQTLALGSDQLNVGATGQFTATVTMPSGFLNNPYVGVTLQNFSGAGNPDATPPTACTNCQAFKTKTTIPLASTFTITGPFGDGTTADTHYYRWQIFVPSSLLDPNYHPAGVWHVDNNGGNGGYLPNCAVDSHGNPLPPIAAPGLCVSSMTTKKNVPNYLTFEGLGVNNGSSWPG